MTNLVISAATNIATNLFADSLRHSLADYNQKQEKNGIFPLQKQVLPNSWSYSEPHPSERPETGNVELTFSGFDFTVSAPIVDIAASRDRERIVIKAQPEENVLIYCGLTGIGISNSGNIRLQEVTFYVDVPVNTPRANFVAATLQVLLWLSAPIHLRIPELKYDRELSFSAPLGQISQYLHRRQIAYQLMVIERTFNKAFLLPVLSDEDEEKIGFAYRAITDRSVMQPFHEHSFPVQADEKMLALIEAGKPFPYHLFVKRFDLDLLGETLPFGEVTLVIEKARIVNPDEARREAGSLNDQQFMIAFRSLDGAIRYDFSNPPALPDGTWDEQVNKLIDLGTLLNKRLMASYHDLAGETLANLTSQEQSEIMMRPELDESAFKFAED